MADVEQKIILRTVDETSGAVKTATASYDELNDQIERFIENERANIIAENAEKAFEGMSEAEKEAFLAARDLDDEQENLEESGGNLANTYTELKSQLELVGQIASQVGEIYNQTIGEYLAQADAVRTLALATGTGNEETSRMIQIFDDAGVEAGQLKTAMLAMKNQGITPSIDAIAKMSTEYNAIKDPLKQVEYLTEKFGNRGAELGKIFDQTEDQIRAAAAAVDDSLVFDDAKIKAAEEMRLAEDDLKDSFTGLKNEIVGEVVPGLAKLTGGFTGLFKALTETDMNGVQRMWVGWTTAISAVKDELVGATTETTAYAGEQDRLRFSSVDLSTSLDNVATSTQNLALGSLAATDAQTYQNVIMEAAVQSSISLSTAYDDQQASVRELEAANTAMFEGLNTNLTNTINNTLEKIEWLNAGGASLQKAYEDAYAALVADPGDPAAQQRIKEMEAASIALDLTLGKIDASTAAKNIADTLGISIGDAYAVLLDLKGDLAKGASLTVDVNYNDPGWQGGGAKTDKGKTAKDKYKQQAAGGEYMADVPYWVGEEGPELRVSSRGGYTVSHEDAMRAISQQTNNYYLSVNSQQSLGSMAQDVALMRGRAGGW